MILGWKFYSFFQNTEGFFTKIHEFIQNNIALLNRTPQNKGFSIEFILQWNRIENLKKKNPVSTSTCTH